MFSYQFFRYIFRKKWHKLNILVPPTKPYLILVLNREPINALSCFFQSLLPFFASKISLRVRLKLSKVAVQCDFNFQFWLVAKTDDIEIYFLVFIAIDIF
jgi:hypothetical protein